MPLSPEGAVDLSAQASASSESMRCLAGSRSNMNRLVAFVGQNETDRRDYPQNRGRAAAGALPRTKRSPCRSCFCLWRAGRTESAATAPSSCSPAPLQAGSCRTPPTCSTHSAGSFQKMVLASRRQDAAFAESPRGLLPDLPGLALPLHRGRTGC